MAGIKEKKEVNDIREDVKYLVFKRLWPKVLQLRWGRDASLYIYIVIYWHFLNALT